jgi:hypothetical protein
MKNPKFVQTETKSPLVIPRDFYGICQYLLVLVSGTESPLLVFNGSRTYEVAEFKCYLIRSDLGRVNVMKRAVCPRVKTPNPFESDASSEVIFDNGGSWPGKDFLYDTVVFFNKLSNDGNTMIENKVQGAIRFILISGN